MTPSTTFVKNNRDRRWILVALMVTITLAAMDTTIVSTAIPHIVSDLGGFSLFGWVFSIYLLAQTVTIPVYGKLADIYGRKPVLIVGTVIFLIGSAVSALSWNMVSLIVFRGIQGLGAGSILATVNTLAGDIYSIKERAHIEGWLSSVWGMSAIMGPSLGGALAEYASWHWIFIINVPVGIVAIALLAIFLHEDVTSRKHKIDYAGAFMMLIAGGVVIYTLMEGGQEWEWNSTTGISLILISVVLIAVSVFIERRAAEPIMPGWVWKDRILIGANVAIMCMGAIMLGPNMYLPVFSQSVLQLGAIAAGLILASMSIGWPVASSLSGRLYLRIGFRNTAMIGSVLIVISSVIFLMLPFNTPVYLMVVDQVLLGAGFGLLSTPMLVGTQAIVKWGQRGVVTGTHMFSRYLGQSIGAAIIGSLFNGAMKRNLLDAPANLKDNLPHKLNDVMTALKSDDMSVAALDYLRLSFYNSTHWVYSAMAVLGVLSFLLLMLLPRRLPVVKE